MGSGMGSGIEKQQHYYTQPGKVAVHQQQMQKSTGLSGLTGGKSQKTEESKSKSEDKFVGGGEGEATEEGKETAAQHGGALVGGFLKTGSKERKTTVGRKMVSDDTEVEEDSEVSESSSTSSVSKTGMNTGTAGDVRVKKLVRGRRHSDSGDLTVEFINDWLRIKKSPGARLSLGDIMSDCSHDQNVDPFILLAIAAAETEYGKKGAGLDGLMGIEDIEGPEEQIVEGAKLFSQLRENDETDEDAPVANQIIAVNRAGWCNDLNWHKSVFKYYQEIKRAWERYSEMKS
ncbi:MAG: hypothetical protein ABRQ38_13865 [Candidatus Eremiobacterota bacterium]